MSKADEMFEELGYTKFEGLYKIEYKGEEKSIEFDKRYNTVIVEKYVEYKDYIEIQELQAINEKCEELGWIE